ncbi:MAG TPA: TonB-dependent receptor [Candidatus Angelobacter sp.]|nr:TonB-dependent receptor [Candidatus Angelobacter sp.]
MQRRQGGCARTAWRSVFAGMLLCLLVLGCAKNVGAQVNTAALSGTVVDPQGLAVKGAKVTVTNTATGASRTSVADDDGRYNLVGLPPGHYKLTVDAGVSFAIYENSAIVLTVGESANFDPHVELKGVQQTVTVSTETAPIETTKSEVSDTVEQRRIENLPINGRSYINFTLTNSQTTRDMAPTIGPAPNSGLSIGGARARGTAVSVDGADAVDNSINAIRATLSQEGIQEFQLILSNYNAEYGRASGGVINIVSKSGSNEFHGDAFGYFRNKAFQARNAFSGVIDPTTGALDPVKQAYTRTQSGLTFGGPIKKDKTFVFFSYEYTQREEAGFSSIGQAQGGGGPFGLKTGVVSTCIPFPLSMTPDQLTSYTALLNTVTGGGASCSNPVALQVEQAAALTAASSNVAVNADMNKNIDGTTVPISTALFGIPAALGSKFFPIPVACPLGQQVNSVVCLPVGPGVPLGIGTGLVPLPASSDGHYHYVPLNSIRGNFPVMEKTSLWSARLDHHWSNHNNSFLRVGVSPSLVTGLPSTSQNQVFGQNSGSRAGLSQTRDLNFTFQHDTIVSDTTFNEFRAQFARRGVHFGFSQLPGGDLIAVNIPGIGYFGREPYSPVDRIERRTEFTDNVTLVRGKHTFKMGGDFNLIQLRSKKQQIFQLDFGGDVNFGGISLGAGVPGATGLQAYGLGIPQSYIQGIGTSNNPFDNIPMGFFLQDNWRLNRHLTVNYGVRYDVEISPLFAPGTAINAAAEKALGVVEGIPRDYNNVAPRIGLAWDPGGDGKTVIRAGYGLFYDHPLLATAFDAVTADGGRSVQLLSIGDFASACGLLPPPAPPVCGSGFDSPTNLNGGSIFQGTLNAPPSLNMFYLPNQQRFDPLAAGSLFANQNYLTAGFPLPILPFTLPLAKNFVYGYANQANLTIEREIAGSWKFSLGYQRSRGIHLNHAQDVNSTDPRLLAQNMFNAVASGLTPSQPLAVKAPSSNVAPTATTCGIGVVAPSALGQLFGCPAPLASLDGQYVGTAAFFNFFRPSGPNPSFAGLVAPGQPLAVGYATQVFLANLAGFPKGFGVPAPFNSVDAQLSNASSWYNALTFNLSKRFSHGIELLSSYTWSHSIDDATDLQSPLEPQDSRFLNLERSNSVNDQRHRWVNSAVFQSPGAKSGDGFFKHFIADFTLSPIIEYSSGRPFNVITGENTRLDFSTSTARPSVGGAAAATKSPFIPGVTFGPPDVCLNSDGTKFTVPLVAPPAGCDGNLGRNAFTSPNFFQVDMRLARRIPLGERFKMDLIADAFNLFNRLNVAAVNQLCDPLAGATCPAGQPTASYDARQFQFALKLSW